MDHNAQWGETKMSVRWSQAAGCWEFSCAWGCHDYDFESEHEATEAFLAHECRIEVPC